STPQPPSPSATRSHPLPLHSSPTRRSSDLNTRGSAGGASVSFFSAPFTARKASIGFVADVRRTLLSAGEPGVRTGVSDVKRTLLDRKSTRLNSSHSQISYAVSCLIKKSRSY